MSTSFGLGIGGEEEEAQLQKVDCTARSGAPAATLSSAILPTPWQEGEVVGEKKGRSTISSDGQSAWRGPAAGKSGLNKIRRETD